MRACFNHLDVMGVDSSVWVQALGTDWDDLFIFSDAELLDSGLLTDDLSGCRRPAWQNHVRHHGLQLVTGLVERLDSDANAAPVGA